MIHGLRKKKDKIPGYTVDVENITVFLISLHGWTIFCEFKHHEHFDS